VVIRLDLIDLDAAKTKMDVDSMVCSRGGRSVRRGGFDCGGDSFEGRRRRESYLCVYCVCIVECMVTVRMCFSCVLGIFGVVSGV
jgi:hypothetical protein